MADHPTQDELSGFVLGTLPSESTDSVAEHIEQCPPCQETICELDAHKDTLLQGLRKPLPPDDEGCRLAIEKVKAIPAKAAAKQPVDSATASLTSLPAIASEAATSGPSREQFLTALRGVRLLDEAEWGRLQREVPSLAQAADGATLARLLVQHGTLTKFQATALYQGKTKGLVFGEYLVLDLLGAGGMGQVFKARHRSMDRVVALKVLAKAAINSPDAVKRFQREVKAAAKLIHPNIVIAHDAGQQDGVHFLVMEYVEGSDLSSLLKREGPLAIDKAVDYITQAARGLAFAHSEGVVHRDIKPANLLLDKKGVVKILDMGLARLDNEAAARDAGEGLTQTGQVMGTVDYMAPEQAFDTSRADGKADVYSLGCTLHRLVVGQNMFNGETLIQKLLAHREQPIPSLRAARVEVTAALDAVYQRMVAKQPSDRPTMAELIVQLETLAKGEASANQADSKLTSFLTTKQTKSNREASRQVPNAGKQTKPQANGTGRKPPQRTMLAAAAAGFVFLALGIVLIVRDKDNNIVAEIDATEGTKVKVTAGGSVEVAAQSPSKPIAVATPLKTPAANPTPPTFLSSATPTAPAVPKSPAAPTSKSNAGLSTPPLVTATKATITKMADGSFDLLKLLDLSRDTLAGDWKSDGDTILSAATENSLFEVPTSVPHDYQLTLTVRRAAGAVSGKGLLIGLPVAGQRVDAGIDVDGGTAYGLSEVEGLEIKDAKNPTRIKGPRPLIDGPNLRTIVCTVRPPQIQVSVDGKTIIDFAEPALMNSNRMTRLFDSVHLETETAMRIERLEIKSLQTVDSWQPRINRERQFPPTGLAAEPAKLPGIGRWQVDTVGTRSNLSCVAISPDGKQVACGNHHGQIRVYDPDTWRLIRCWTAYSVRKFNAVNSLAWSPDGTRIASAGTDGLCLWQPDGTLLAIRSLGGEARVCWSADGSRLAVGTRDSTIRLIDRDGTVGTSFKTNKGGFYDLCFSPDGQQLVYAAGNNKAHIINLDGSSGPVLVGQEGSVEGVSWSKLGQIATVSTDKTLRFWGSDGKPGPVVRDLAQGNGTLKIVRWSPDGTRLIVGDNSPLFVLSATGEVLAKESHGGQNLGGVAWSADGQRVAYVANHFQRGYHTGIWDLKGKPWNMPEYQPTPETLAWSPDGRHLAMSTHGGRKARIIHADGTVAFSPFPKGLGLGDFAWSPDSKRLALSSENTIRVFDVSDSSIVASPTVVQEGADRVRWSPDGRYLVSRGGDKTIRLWNIDGTPGPVLQAEIGRGALAWLTADTLMVGDTDSSKQRILQQWKVDGTKGLAWPISVSPDHVAVSPDGRILLVNGGNSGRIRLDLTSKESSRIGEGPGNSSWSKDGMQWLTSSQNNHGGAVRLMDTATNMPVHVLPLFEPRVAELSSTGVIAVCASDYTVRAWDSVTGRPLWTTVCLNDDQSITLAADGRVLQHGDVKLDDVLFYSVERDDGRVDTLTYNEFRKVAPRY